MGTYTLNTDMDYRALLNGMSANSSTKATVSVTITEGMTVSETALHVGLGNLSYFIRLFRQRYGQTPKQYQLGLTSRKK